jgi:hypothetical protein
METCHLKKMIMTEEGKFVHTLGILGFSSTGMQQVNNLSLQKTKDFLQ